MSRPGLLDVYFGSPSTLIAEYRQGPLQPAIVISCSRLYSCRRSQEIHENGSLAEQDQQLKIGPYIAFLSIGCHPNTRTGTRTMGTETVTAIKELNIGGLGMQGYGCCRASWRRSS